MPLADKKEDGHEQVAVEDEVSDWKGDQGVKIIKKFGGIVTLVSTNQQSRCQSNFKLNFPSDETLHAGSIRAPSPAAMR